MSSFVMSDRICFFLHFTSSFILYSSRVSISGPISEAKLHLGESSAVHFLLAVTSLLFPLFYPGWVFGLAGELITCMLRGVAVQWVTCSGDSG